MDKKRIQPASATASIVPFPHQSRFDREKWGLTLAAKTMLDDPEIRAELIAQRSDIVDEWRKKFLAPPAR